MSINNRCTFTGHLGADPEQFNFSENKTGVKFSLAISENYKDLNGEWKTKTDWLKAVCYREGLVKYILKSKKGDKVMITAKYNRKEYADRDAVVQHSVQFIIEEFMPFVNRKGIETPAHEKGGDEDVPF